MRSKKSDRLQKKLKELQMHAAREKLNIADDITRIVEKISGENKTETDAWNKVLFARHAARPNTLEYVRMIFDDFIELHGDRSYADDPAMVGGVAKLRGLPVTFIGTQKGHNLKENLARNYGMCNPEGYRKALRLVHEAEKFKRPVISFIDTQGAYPGIGAEERGISEAIARNLKEFSVLRVPIVCFVTGEGGSGGALGIGVGDEVYMLENAVYSVITPEGCASIILRDSSQAPKAAEMMRMTAQHIMELGIIDGIIPEPPGGAHQSPQLMAGRIRDQMLVSLNRLRRKKPEALIRDRSNRLRIVGQFHENVRGREKILKRISTRWI